MFSSESSAVSYHFFGIFCMILSIYPTEWQRLPVLKTEPCFLRQWGTRASWQSQANLLSSKQFESSKIERKLRREKPWKTKLVDVKNKFHFYFPLFFPTVSFFPFFFCSSQFDFLNNTAEHIPLPIRQLSVVFHIYAHMYCFIPVRITVSMGIIISFSTSPHYLAFLLVIRQRCVDNPS